MEKVHADFDERGALRLAGTLYRDGRPYDAARFAFAAIEEDSTLAPHAYAAITQSLVKSGLYNAASYFFIRTLMMRNSTATGHALEVTQDLMVNVGVDLFRKFLIQYTDSSQFDAENRNAYLYAVGKALLLAGQNDKAIESFGGVSDSSPFKAPSLQMRGTALVLQGRLEDGLTDFRTCQSEAASKDQDLRARCIAGEARTLYELGRFKDASFVYDKIPKASFVWTDALFEQAWNAYALGEYNRALGKLVTYKSPDIEFVFNPEIDVLRGMSYLSLCLYADVNQVVNEFNDHYASFGKRLKTYIESNDRDLGRYFAEGKRALRESVHTKDEVLRLLNRFVRSPYFEQLVRSEKAIDEEERRIAQFERESAGGSAAIKSGLSGFLAEVLKWRRKSVEVLGAMFVKNSLLDYYSQLLKDAEKIQFMKLDMLQHAKSSLLGRSLPPIGRQRGNIEPSRRGDQYYWSFNGEFWIDEIGDYVFGLDSECKQSEGG